MAKMPIASDCQEELLRVPGIAQESLLEPEFMDIFGMELSALSNSYAGDNGSVLCG
jgi:hypothetical protein